MANIRIKMIKETYRNIIKFLSHDIWVGDFTEVSKAMRRAIRYLKVFITTTKEFFNRKIGLHAINLTYFTILAIVPLVAIGIFVTNRFGLDAYLSTALYDTFANQKYVIDVILSSANNIINTTNSGLFGWIGLLSFIWTIFWLMLSVENSFNHIWHVDTARKLYKRLIVYVTVLILAPFVVVLFVYTSAYYTLALDVIFPDSRVFKFIESNLYWLVFYGLTVLVLSLIYKFIPHVKVRYSASLRASVMSGFFFVLLQYLYISTQMMVSRLNSVYGVFALFPLLLIWLNFSWQVILLGAELSYSFQYIEEQDELKFMEMEKNKEIEENGSKFN